MHPGTSLGPVKAGMIDGLEDLDPTGLKDILGQTVVAGDPLGEREEAAGAAGNPGVGIAFKQGAAFGCPLEFRGGQNVKFIGQLSEFPLGQFEVYKWSRTR